MVYRPEDDWIENTNNNNGNWQCLKPMITNGFVNVLNIFKQIIYDCYEYYMES